jgi:hypothetical protein
MLKKDERKTLIVYPETVKNATTLFKSLNKMGVEFRGK